jgi:hypothetical protein
MRTKETMCVKTRQRGVIEQTCMCESGSVRARTCVCVWQFRERNVPARTSTKWNKKKLGNINLPQSSKRDIQIPDILLRQREREVLLFYVRLRWTPASTRVLVTQKTWQRKMIIISVCMYGVWVLHSVLKHWSAGVVYIFSPHYANAVMHKYYINELTHAVIPLIIEHRYIYPSMFVADIRFINAYQIKCFYSFMYAPRNGRQPLNKNSIVGE